MGSDANGCTMMIIYVELFMFAAVIRLACQQAIEVEMVVQYGTLKDSRPPLLWEAPNAVLLRVAAVMKPSSCPVCLRVCSCCAS